MSSNVFKIIEITGTSSMGIEDAIQSAVARASQTVHNMKWFEISETRGRIDDNQVTQFQVTLKIGFLLEE